MRQQALVGRAPLMALTLFTLLAAMWAGLVRMGWNLPALSPTLTGNHGPLMISGVLGTLIGLERAVGLGERWAYFPPALTAAGAIAFMAPLPAAPGAVLVTLGSVGMVCVFAVILRRQPVLHSAVMAFGALLWLGGNVLWLAGEAIPVLVPWWAGFLILTIAGERLELSRLLHISRTSRWLFAAIALLLVAGLTVTVTDYTLGWRINGAAFLLLALWLLRHDIARRTVRQPGLTRFIAVCMLSGYLWLGVAGGIALTYGFLTGGSYDATLHSIFLGFVFAMIFGHAPIIFPAVLRLTMPYRPLFYGHLALLHLSLVVRVAGDLTGQLPVWRWGGMLNVVALLLFLSNTALAVRGGQVSPSRLRGKVGRYPRWGQQ